jgi:regulator of sigma E protease
VLETIGSVLLAILVLLIMITIHEFGHYIVGKIFKFKINEFAIGMGPAIFKKTSKKTGEVFSIRVFPLGGFCAFEGEDEDSQSENAFNSKSPWKRLCVLLAGATMNCILGVLVLILSVGVYGQILINTYDIKPTIAPEYAGYSLENGDTIKKINGKFIMIASDVTDVLNGKNAGDIVEVEVVDKNGEVKTRSVRLRNAVNSDSMVDVISSYTAIGVSTIVKMDKTTVKSKILDGEYLLRLADNENYDDCTRIFTVQDIIPYAKTFKVGETCSFYVRYADKDEKKLISVQIEKDLSTLTDDQILLELGIQQHSLLLKYTTKNVRFGFMESIGRGLRYSYSVAGTIFRTLGELLTGKLSITAMGGPITTISVTSNAIKDGGFNYFLEIMGFIGINLAVFNLLPIPALDGSRAVFCIIEGIRKKPINRKVEGIIHAVGLFVLLGFCILVDILQMF